MGKCAHNRYMDNASNLKETLANELGADWYENAAIIDISDTVSDFYIEQGIPAESTETRTGAYELAERFCGKL